ncbi:RNA polymerase sigma-70 factor [Sphingobacterium sp. DR205]|uniref:RNA polymerase sigma factor n=1 Tax=Sphingobacterium sp. DR205 TaxID=2713573 RepID=UPI0013E47209|nr:RNA polymerase sigma-70 factor [Sphingobacterium sp. DR205]QIH35476.1 RNA polymerase sigma-70 factor [Sphingobacterium sp. DR205]
MYCQTDLSDKELLALVLKKDEQAFGHLYERYFPLLFIYAHKIISDEEVVKDILQDVFVSLWSKTSLEINTSFSSYIYAAVRFQLFDYIDKQKVRKGYADSLQHFLDQGEYSTDNYLLEKELQQQIEKEIMNLPPKMREIFILSRQQEKSYEEIAKQSNVSLNTVRKQVSNALKIMRSKFTLLFFTFF